MPEFTWSRPPPGPGRTLILTFPPTRTFIQRISVPAAERSGLAVAVAGPISAAEWPLVISYVGERLQDPVAIEAPSTDRFVLLIPHCDDLRKAWYAGRSFLAATSAVQRFFFELDREFNAEVLYIRELMGEHVDPVGRNAMVQDLSLHLADRLRGRRNGGKGPGGLPGPAAATQSAIRECSGIFRRLADDLGRAVVVPGVSPTEVLARAFEMFAAGDTEAGVVVGDDPRTAARWLVSTPDSANILMFAEFALAAIDLQVDQDMWCAVLPSLVRMQWYFWARVTMFPRPLDGYGPPERPLAVADRLAIARDLPLSLQRDELEDRIYDKLAVYVTP